MDSSLSTLCRQTRRRNFGSLTSLLRSALVLCLIPLSSSKPVPLPFSTCAPSTVTESNPLKRVNVTSVYGQVYHADDPQTRQLKITAFGEIGDTLDGYSNTTGYLGRSLLPIRFHGDSLVLVPPGFLLAQRKDHMLHPETSETVLVDLGWPMGPAGSPEYHVLIADFCSFLQPLYLRLQIT